MSNAHRLLLQRVDSLLKRCFQPMSSTGVTDIASLHDLITEADEILGAILKDADQHPETNGDTP